MPDPEKPKSASELNRPKGTNEPVNMKVKSTTPIPGQANTNGPTDTNGKPNFEDNNKDALDSLKNNQTNDTTKASGADFTNSPNDPEKVKAANDAVRANVQSRVTNASNQSTDSKGTPGFESPTERRPSDLGPDRPGYQEPTNDLQSQDLAEGDNFNQKELNHPHVNAFTPNTTMSGGPFTPDTQDKKQGLAGRATLENNVPVKTYVRHPFEAAGNLAGVTPVLVEDRKLTESQVHQRIAQVLKDGGMDSASQLKAFAQIKVILDAWEPQDSDRALTRKEAIESQEQTDREVDSEMKTDDQRDKDTETKANLQKSMLSSRVANEGNQAQR